MRRATTPTHSFDIPIDAGMIRKILLTYTQNEEIVLEKTEEDMTFDGQRWVIKLTQEEANLFQIGPASAQIRVLTTGGDALASDEIRLHVYKTVNDEVML